MFVKLIASLALVILFFVVCIRSKSRYSMIVGGCWLIIGFMLDIAVLYTSKFSFYEYVTRFDYHLYSMVSGLRIGVGDMQYILNTLFILYLCLMSMCVLSESNNKIIKGFALAIPILFFAVTTSPYLIMIVYTELYFTHDLARMEFGRMVYDAVQNVNVGICILYMFLAVLSIVKKIINTKIYLKQRYYAILGVNILLSDLFIIFFVLSGYIGEFSFLHLGFELMPDVFQDTNGLNVAFNIYILLVIVIALLTIYCDMKYSVWNVRKYRARNIDRYIDENLRIFLHSYKNSYFTVFALANQAQENPTVTDKNICMIKQYAFEILNDLDNNISKLKAIKLKRMDLILAYVIEHALKKSTLKLDNIDVQIMDNSNLCVVSGDESYLIDMFVNIFNNSAEALYDITTREKYVKIFVHTEHNMVVVTVEDNGCGISKENLKHVYDPMFSTKRSATNWGVGLNYIRKILLEHRGSIYIKSEEGMYTKVQITLPVKRKEMI